jgi:hypothetical protein
MRRNGATIERSSFSNWNVKFLKLPWSKTRRGWSRPWPIFCWRLWLSKRNWEAWMNPKITPDHLGRAAIVYVRQSTMAQVTGNLESQRRQFDLAKTAAATGFSSMTVIDDDLGHSG